MYVKSGPIYDLMYSTRDYSSLGANLVSLVRPYLRDVPVPALLEVGCGTGRALETLAPLARELHGIDVNVEMLDIAKQRLPEATLAQADMMTLELPHRYGVICCLFGTIAFARTPGMLEATVTRLARHLTADGLLVMETYFTPEEYWPRHVVSNHVETPELKLAWMYRHEVHGRLAVTKVHHLLGTPENVEHFVDTFEVGLFTTEEYEKALRGAGLEFERFANARPGRCATYVAARKLVRQAVSPRR
jgi:ubiquinone/menaquinone biosynthesis C-methylase UbiE